MINRIKVRKFIEKLPYSWGYSCTNVKSFQLDFLRKNVPPEFKNKKMVDIGCGDGRITKVLADIFEASAVLGIDYIPALVASAKKRGIPAKILDIEKQNIKGELAIMWGALHHLISKDKVLKELAVNFQYVFIREELPRFKIFEIGQLMEEKELKKAYARAFGQENILPLKDPKEKALFLFYKNPNYQNI